MGRFNGGTIVPGTIIGTDVSLTADLAVQSMRHCFKPTTHFGQAIGATPATREEIVYVTSGVGSISGFHAMLNDTGSSTSITFDLKVDGVSILSAPITITNSDADREVLDGVLTSNSFIAGKVISIAMVVGSATGATGACAWLTLVENQAPV
jgi:hypothetical protein